MEEEIPYDPSEEIESAKKGLPCTICNVLKRLKRALQNCLPKKGLLGKMSITEEEKKEIED